MAGSHKYDQKVKAKARRTALKRAVELVTTRRDAAAIVPGDYVRRVRRAKRRGSPYDAAAVAGLRRGEIRDWERYRGEVIGTRKASEITVAYLAGPDPENDLAVLLELGVRPENIWAFESRGADARKGHERLSQRATRGVKFLHIDIEDFFIGSSRRFDIIYIDACDSLPKGSRLLVTLFQHAALAPLGVLITNFSKPDMTNPDLLDKHVHAVAAYLYGKDFLDLKEGGWTDAAPAHGYVMSPAELEPVDTGGDASPSKDQLFHAVVRSDFAHYYGSFVTRHVMDIAALIAPMARLSQTRFWAQLSSRPMAEAASRGREMLVWPEWPETPDDDDLDAEVEVPKGGEAISEGGTHSLLQSFAMCGAYGELGGYDLPPEQVRPFIAVWMESLRGKPAAKQSGADLAAAYYGLRADADLQTEGLKSATQYAFRDRMPFLCDVPNAEIGFFPAIAQFAHPSHCNVREVRRYRYSAKKTEMFLDVLPFDECRYVYDWQSVFSLMAGDWSDRSSQLIFRFAIDAIAKSARYYQNDFLHGCHSVGIDHDGFPAAELKRRRNLSRKAGKKRKKG